MFGQGAIKKIQRLLGQENVLILAAHARQKRVRLFEHNAYDFIRFSRRPCVAYRFAPGCAELFGGMEYVVSVFGMVLVIADAWVEWNRPQLCSQLPLCQCV